MYSQSDEEAVILARFADRAPGRFLDIGAHDGIRFSNTRALSDRGWTGTLVEPSPAAFVALMDAYRERPGSRLVHVAVAPPGSSGILAFADSRGDFVSTFDASHKAAWDGRAGHLAGGGGVQFQEIHVAAVSMDALLVDFPGPYAFVSLDVEGINAELFVTLPLRHLRVELVCVEYQDRFIQIAGKAAEEGYHLVHKTGENAIFAVNA